MKIREIDGTVFYHFMIAGANRLIHHEHELNSINVFPVADGDTGTNLALTMRTIINQTIQENDFSQTIHSISKTAIENAYGNSGIIFAQYLNGLNMEASKRNKLSIDEFVDMTEKATMHTYQAVSDPKEGTILTVMKEWSSSLKNNIHLADFEKMFEESVQKTRNKVEQTKYMLKVLMKHNVVDAGAKGFLLFLEGMLDYIKSGKTISAKQIKAEFNTEHVNLFEKDLVSENAYCFQLTVETNMDMEACKKKLKPYGNSLVVTKIDETMRIHIHTDHPEKVVEAFGDDQIISQKFEDMTVQSGIEHKKKHPIALVTDSIADIPLDYIRENQITVIPVHLICDSKVYLDKVTMTSDVFYERLSNYQMNPTSAQPTIKSFEEAFAYLLKHFDSIIGIFVSSKMSGIYNNAQRAVKQLDSSKKISIIDSKINSAAEGLLVMEAIEQIQQKKTHEEVVEALEEIKKNIHIYVSVNDLSSMIKGGRVSKTKGFILNKIDLKPVISIDEKGNGMIYKKSLTTKKAVKGIMAKAQKDMKETGIKAYGLVYSDSKELVETLKEKMVALTNQQPVFVEAISPVVGLNAGKQSFALAYVKKGRTK